MPARTLLPILLVLALASAAHAAAEHPLPASEGFARDNEYPSVHWYPAGEYIPGYGQQDPAYTYAHTDTLSVTFVGHHWRQTCHETAAGATWTGTAAVEFLPALKPRVDGLTELSGTLIESCPGIEPSGTVAVRLVRFTPRRAERFAALRRYTIERANFELWRKPSGVFMPKWTRIGTAYRLSDRAEECTILTGFPE